VKTGERFCEPDERLAIQRYRAACPSETTFVTIAKSIDPYEIAQAADKLGGVSDLAVIEHDDGTEEIGYDLDKQTLWNWFREHLIEKPLQVARATGYRNWQASPTAIPDPRPS